MNKFLIFFLIIFFLNPFINFLCFVFSYCLYIKYKNLTKETKISAYLYAPIAKKLVFNTPFYYDCDFYDLYNLHNVINTLSSTSSFYLAKTFLFFSPMYWINLIIFFPKKILEKLHLPQGAFSIKIFSLLWWVSAPLFTPLAESIREKIILFLSNILNHLIN